MCMQAGTFLASFSSTAEVETPPQQLAQLIIFFGLQSHRAHPEGELKHNTELKA